jgi:hypothetical protein
MGYSQAVVKVTEQANDAWDDLLGPERPRSIVHVAKRLLAEIDADPRSAEQRAESFDDPGLEGVDGLRTLIDSGPPPLYIVWCRTGEEDSVVLDFIHMSH